MNTATIRNTYHMTEAVCHPDDNGWLTARQVRRMRSTLCGLSSCMCGGKLSEFGAQRVTIEPDLDSDGHVIARVLPRD